MNDALGLIEIKGLAGAITIADAMVKTANVELLGIEKAKGFGWITIKISGDVGAVTAAVSTGQALAEQHDQFVAAKVIPRPSQSVGEVFGKPSPKKQEVKKEPEPEPEEQPEQPIEVGPEETPAFEPELLIETEPEPVPEEAKVEPEVVEQKAAEPEETQAPVAEENEVLPTQEVLSTEASAPVEKPAKTSRSAGKSQRNKRKPGAPSQTEIPGEESR